METDKIVCLLHEKLQEYEPYGYDDDREDKVFAESDVLQALYDVFADIEQDLDQLNQTLEEELYGEINNKISKWIFIART